MTNTWIGDRPGPKAHGIRREEEERALQQSQTEEDFLVLAYLLAHHTLHVRIFLIVLNAGLTYF